MTPERYSKIGELFHAALEFNAHERAAFLERVCAGDAGLRREVESLIRSHGEGGGVIDDPALAVAAELLAGDEQIVGQTLAGRYRVLSFVGAGGMGRVYLAEDAELGRRVALKLLPAHLAHDAEQARRFRQEARAASALNHPNIITVYGVEQTGGTSVIASEYIEGETLRERLSRGPLLPAEALDIALQIASALRAAHVAGIVHRDVKPENVMLRPDGYVKVLDFGIAKLAPRQPSAGNNQSGSEIKTHPGLIMGTDRYMSPEQARGREVDARADVWSLGCIIYEMLSGGPPFTGETASDVVAAVLKTDPVPLAQVATGTPVELQRIVRKCLEKDREERYPAAKDLLDDLRRLQKRLEAGEAGGAVPPARRRFAARTALFIPLALVVSICLGLYFYKAGGVSPLADKKSIAVLPLKPIGAANRDEIYEVGIADSLIYKLGAMKGFVVRPLSAVRKYADLEQDPLAAGREQQVDFVLASNYQIAGGKIRVTSQLLNIKTGQVEETYKSEKDVSNIFAMQDAVGEEVGKLLRARFALPSSNPKGVRGTDNEEAYRLYLQAQYLIEKGGAANATQSMKLFDEALALDPNYAKAWAGKARAHFYFPLVGDRTPEEEYAITKHALERALALDNNLAEAYAMRGIVLNDYEWDFAQAEKQFLRATELAPDSSLAYRWYARRLAGQGRYDEAIASIKTAIDLNPSSVTEQVIYGRILYFARRYDEAIAQLQRVLEIDDAQAETYAYLWRCHHLKGDERRAYEIFLKFHRALGTKDEIIKKYETAYAKDGWRGALRTALHIRQTEATTGNGAYDVAMLSALLNQSDQAFRYLDDAVKMRSANISNLPGDPGLDPLRGDPRFDELIRRLGSK